MSDDIKVPTEPRPNRAANLLRRDPATVEARKALAQQLLEEGKPLKDIHSALRTQFGRSLGAGYLLKMLHKLQLRQQRAERKAQRPPPPVPTRPVPPLPADGHFHETVARLLDSGYRLVLGPDGLEVKR